LSVKVCHPKKNNKIPSSYQARIGFALPSLTRQMIATVVVVLGAVVNAAGN